MGLSDHRHDQLGELTLAPVFIDMPGVLPGVAIAGGRQLVFFQKALHCCDDGLHGYMPGRIEIKEHPHAAGACAHAHL